MMFDLKPYLLLLWKWRRFLSVNFAFVAVVSIILAFFVIKKEYLSRATFLPPVAGSGPMLALAGNPLMGLLAGGNDAGDNIEAVFDSKILKRKIIEEFNLYENYNLAKSPNKFELAVKRLENQVMLSSELKGRGIGMSKTISYSVECYHTSPDTAFMMAEFIFASLDSAMVGISISKASRNREFIETQFMASQDKLDSLHEEFKEFQITHKAFDVSEQMNLTLRVYADVKAASVINDMRLMALRREFRGDAPEITSALNDKRVYDRKLAELEQNQEYSVMPSLNLSSELMPKYMNIRRALEVQNRVHLLLTGELEQARLQEARDVSPLVLIDPPYRAEYKARPKRGPMALIVTGGYMFALMFIIVSYKIVTDFIQSFSGSKKPAN